MSTPSPRFVLVTLTSLSTLLAIQLLSSQEVAACQPEPDTGYITSVLPLPGSEAVGIDADIALRWERAAIHRAEPLSQFYYYGEFGGFESFATFEFKQNGQVVDISGRFETDWEWKELRFSPSSYFEPNTSYEVLVQFNFGDTYSWNFKTMEERSYSDM